MRQFLSNTAGATAIEYALIGALIVLVMLVSLVVLGTKTEGMYNNVATQVQQSM